MDYKEIYCLILFPQQLSQAFALDRSYNFLTDDRAIWGKITMGDILQVDRGFFAGQLIPYWAEKLEAEGHYHIALWTTFYDDRRTLEVEA